MQMDVHRGWAKRGFAVVSAWLVGVATGASVISAQAANPLPFGAGERFTFVVSTTHLGKVGEAAMALTGPVDVRGSQVLVASFDTRIRVALMTGTNESKSWIDPSEMTSLRFAKHEHRPFSSNDDSVEIVPDRHRWDGAHGASGVVTSDRPLDELSFIYFLRTQSFLSDSTYSFDRHYDARRNPTLVRVVNHETISTPAGEFRTVELEMRVKDGTDYNGDGVLHLWFSADRCRVPIRIESRMPLLGVGILTLETAVTPACGAAEPGAPTHQLEN
jgi:Protein of unknown function (DUF3108)